MNKLRSISQSLSPYIHKHNGRYAVYGVLAFVASTLVSYKIFRHNELDVEVRLADVTFSAELPRSAEGDATLKPGQVWPVAAPRAGKVDKILIKDNDVVKKGQTLAYVDTTHGEADLKSALAYFKSHKDQPEARERLESAKQKLLGSVLRAPADGTVKLVATLDANVPEGGPVAEVIDTTQLMATVKLQLPITMNLSNPTKVIATSPALTQPVELEAKLRRSRENNANVSGAGDLYDVVMDNRPDLAKLVHQPVHIKIALPPYKQVALVDKAAIVKQDADSKILVLNTFGFVRWYNVSKAPIVNERVLIEGVSPEFFRVVLPEHLEVLKQAVAQSARPRVISGKG